MNKKEIDFVVSIIDNIPLLKASNGKEKIWKPEYEAASVILRDIQDTLNMSWDDFMDKHKKNKPRKSNQMTRREIDFVVGVINKVHDGNYKDAKKHLRNIEDTIYMSWADFKAIYQTKKVKKLTLAVYEEITSTKEGKEHFDKSINGQLDDLMQMLEEEDSDI